MASLYAAGLTELLDDTGTVVYEMRVEVLEAGAATLGEFSDQHGSIGTRTLRVQVLDKETGHRFFLIPIGFSTTSWDGDNFNQTLFPDLYYFSFQASGTPLDTRIVSFCTTAYEKPTTATCFLGHGQQEWDDHVQKWSTFYYNSVVADGNTAGRRVWSSGGANVGGKVGGYAGGKIGGKVGGVVGGDVGGAVGGVVGGAVAGPVGAAVGEEVGHWAGQKVGRSLGRHYGKEIGHDAGTAVGGRIGPSDSPSYGHNGFGGEHGGGGY